MIASKKVFYIVSHLQKSLGLEWTAEELKRDFDLTFVLLNPGGSSLETFLRGAGIPVVHIRYRDKRDFPRAVLSLCFLFLRKRPDVVHTHLVDATLAGITAGWLTKVYKRIYTRHNSTFHHLYFPNAVKYDRWVNRRATHIVSISQATDKVLLDLEQVPPGKLRKIPHGFDLTVFSHVPPERIAAVKKKWNLPDHGPRVGVVARHIEWKGIQFIIPAFREFLKLFPDATLILANASGPYHDKVLELLKPLPPGSSVLIPFEEDVAAMYQLFDLYVHTPVDSTCEAFGQTYVEALASGIPSVVTLSGVAAEFIRHGENAWVVDFRNSDQISKALQALWVDPSLRNALIENGKRSVDPAFAISPMIRRLRELYNE